MNTPAEEEGLLPNVLAINQVEKLFSELENLRHQTMLFLAYSAGLRVSEVVNLKIRYITQPEWLSTLKGQRVKKTAR